MSLSRLLRIAILFSGTATAQNFVLDVADGSNVPVPASRMIPVHVTYIGDDAAVKGFKIVASRFSSDQDSVPVDILRSCDINARAENQPVAFPLLGDQTAPLCLRIPELSGDSKYSGTLILFPDNKKPETPKKFSLSRPTTPPATLATDRQVLTVELERPPWALFSAFDAPIGSVALQEKSAKGSAKGVAAQIDSTLKTPGAFDPATNLAFQWNREDWVKPFSTLSSGATANAGAGTIDPGAQAEIAITAKNLRPGEYSIPVRFTALGATTDNAKVSMTVRVRDSVLLAIAALLIALILSFVITKMLTGKRHRITLLQQIHDLRVSKGSTLPRLPAVVWVESVLHLAERLSSRFWLTGADIIDAHVNSVRSTVDLLKQVRELLASLQQRRHNLVFNRAAESIGRIVSELGSEPPDDAMTTRIKTELTVFNDWLQDTTFPAALWNTIQPALQKLHRDIDTGAIPDNVKDAINPLKSALDAALTNPPQTAATVEQSYRDYARLRIMWDCRNESDVFAKMIAKPEPGLEECFTLYDNLAWERLKRKSDSLKVQIPGANSSDGLEAFMPIAFSVTADDKQASGSYLFRHKVQYAWKFTLEPGTPKWHEKLRGKKQDKVILTPITLGPSVVQYFPRRGKVNVQVTMSYAGDPISLELRSGPVIRDSSEFGMLKAFEGVEYVSWAIAAAVALATGLSTYYFKNPTFGSYQDYLTLMLWGVGMDQGKNFLQALQSVSGQSTSAQTPH